MAAYLMSPTEAMIALKDIPSVNDLPIPPEGLWLNLDDGSYIIIFLKTDGNVLYIHSDVKPSLDSSNWSTAEYVTNATIDALKKSVENVIPSWGMIAAFLLGAVAIYAVLSRPVK